MHGYEFQPDYKGEQRDSMKWYYRVTFSGRQRKVMAGRKNVNGHLMETCEEVDDTVRLRYLDRSLGYRPRNLRKYFRSIDLL